jgi:hypothetical protein
MATSQHISNDVNGTPRMNMTKIVDIIFVAALSSLLLTQTGCPDDNKSAEETGPASGGTSGEQAAGETTVSEAAPEEPARPEEMPLLCSLDGGKWCSPCPKGDAGPLCCAGETCAPWVDGEPACSGVVGWCNNYTTSQHCKAEGACVNMATCHDAG